jgi:hypothetical protein
VDPLTPLTDQLEAAGFARTETGPDRQNFGNRLIELDDGRLRVRLTLDRSVWTIELRDHDADVWRAALDGTDPTVPAPVDEQAEWVGANLDRIRRGARDQRLRRRLDEVAEARARHLFD